MLTKQTIEFLDAIKSLNLPSITETPHQVLRESYETMALVYGGSRLENVPHEDHNIQIQFINDHIKIRIFDIKEPQGIMLYAHGGGWTRGSLDTHHVMCQNLAIATQHQVIAIDYSLSPEHIFPKALDEIEAIYHWVLLSQLEGRLADLPVSVAGDSAGANLMAALIVRLHYNEFPAPKICVFFYPSFDLTGKMPSLDEFAEGHLLTKYAVTYYVNNYLGNNLELAKLPEVSPLWQMHKVKFPPTLIIAAEADPIRDDARTAKFMLEMQKSLVGYLEVPGVIHAFAQFPILFPEAKEVFDWIANFFAKKSKD
mgnify:CR=1 FL=1